MAELARRIILGAALGAGTIVLSALLLAVVDLARIERPNSGDVFQRAAVRLTGIVVIEVVAVALIAAAFVWKGKSVIGRMVLLTVVVWIVSAFDFAFLALGGLYRADQ